MPPTQDQSKVQCHWRHLSISPNPLLPHQSVLLQSIRPLPIPVLKPKPRLFRWYVGLCLELLALLTPSSLSVTRTRSVIPIAWPADEAAIHLMIRKISATGRNPSASPMHRERQPPARSASPRKRLHQPVSEPDTASMVQQTMESESYFSATCSTAACSLS